MISDEPLDAQVVDLNVLADTLTSALAGEPGLLRLEPTVRSLMNRVKSASTSSLRSSPRPSSKQPAVAIRDGLVLSLSEGLVNVNADIATNIEFQALTVAANLQRAIAQLIQRSGHTVGTINVTILAVEGMGGLAEST